MIDTIVLMLSKYMYHINDPDKFKPSARWALGNSSATFRGMQSKQNPAKQELLSGIYKPRLTLFHHISPLNMHEIVLKVELSLPKLIYGNNFEELKSKDLDLVIQKLVETLETMGVVTTAQQLSRSPVSGIHYSKNIPLTDGSTPYHYINKIKEANIKLSLDVNQTDYRNDGHSYKWHCNSYEVVFYDKIKDLEQARQNSKRALEKDSTLQLNLFDTLKKRKKLEILRMEVRLNKRQKIKQLFKILSIKSNLTFKSLFKMPISKKILLHYINELESKRPILLNYKATNDKTLLADLIVNNPHLSSKQILQMFGLTKALESVTIRELRGMFGNCSKKSWYRLISDAKKVELLNIASPFETIKKQLRKFKPFRF